MRRISCHFIVIGLPHRMCQYTCGPAGNFLATAEELTSNGFRSVMEIDALGTFNMSRAAYPALAVTTGLSCVINISATLHYGASWYQVWLLLSHSIRACSPCSSASQSWATLEYQCWSPLTTSRGNGAAPRHIHVPLLRHQSISGVITAHGVRRISHITLKAYQFLLSLWNGGAVQFLQLTEECC